MTNALNKSPDVGTLVRPAGGSIVYRVTESRPTGCSVEATVTECTPVPGRQPRPLHYSEKRASLAFTRDGQLVDSRWNAWEVVA